jgi:hypothetical protein
MVMLKTGGRASGTPRTTLSSIFVRRLVIMTFERGALIRRTTKPGKSTPWLTPTFVVLTGEGEFFVELL